MNNKKYYEIGGFFGLICFLFGLALILVKREISAYTVVNLLLGLGGIAYFLYFNIREVSKVFVITGKKASKDVILQSGLIIGIVIGVNLLSSVLYFGKDLTSDKVSSISDNSQKVIKWIKEPLEVLVFSPGEKSDYQKFLLDSYNFYNRKISYRFLDPEQNPQAAQQYGITKTGEAVIKYKDGFAKIDNVTEEFVTNAIIRMTQNVKNTVYFLMQHGEHPVDDINSNQGYGLAWRELIKENYAVSKLKLEPPNYYIPGNCTILICAGPRSMYTQLEIKAVREYLDNGGRAVFMLDPNVRTGLEDFIGEYGIKLENDCLVDVVFPSLIERLTAGIQGRKAYPKPVFQVIVRDFPDTEITKDFKDKDKSVIMSVARSMNLPDKEKDQIRMDLQIEPLAKTTDKGWSETDLEGLFSSARISPAVYTRKGPHITGMLSTKGTRESNSKIIVLGDSDFINNEYIHQLSNRDFFMNCMAYLSKQANLISVRPRHLFASRLDYDPVTMSRIFTISVLIFPQLFLMAGIAIWWLRR